MDSEPALVRTLEATPTGFLPPSLRVDSSSEVTVSWAKPAMPNGVILSYVLLRLSQGFETVAEDCCSAYLANISGLPQQCMVAAVVGAEVNSVLESGLLPYSFYQYCVIVGNSVGSISSGHSDTVRTSPAPMPLRGPVINATTVNSTAILVQWDSLGVEDLLGPFSGYELYIRESSMSGLGTVIFQGNDLSFVATDLLASTEYVFTVSVSNSVGSTFSENISATTEEGSECGTYASGQG